MEPVPSTITKTYPKRGPLQQFRFAEATAFNCFRCGEPKKAKLITVYCGDWSRRLCNGCYGRLLSLYEIKAGTDAEDERAEQLANALLSLVAQNDQNEAERLFRASEARADRLSGESIRFIATAEHVAKYLHDDPQLEWSPAIIGLCKAFEVEIVRRILRPLADRVARMDLRIDKEDKDLRRVAAFCDDPTRKPPELGTFAHFLHTAIHSGHRRASSVLLINFLKLIADWPGSHWLLQQTGLHKTLTTLTARFRNRAAHTDELCKEDYIGCRDLVIGSQGTLWKLLLATEQ